MFKLHCYESHRVFENIVKANLLQHKTAQVNIFHVHVGIQNYCNSITFGWTRTGLQEIEK